MSDQAPRDLSPNPPPHTSNNTGMKWLAGCAAAALLLGGGYYAMKNVPPPQPGAQVASTDGGYGATTNAVPVTPNPIDQTSPTDSAASSTVTTSSTTSTTTRSAAPARKRAAMARADASIVPEAVIGVTPASQDDNEVVVTGARRPVWSRTPSARSLSLLYPDTALQRGREGEASVHCTVQDKGALNCVRASETPANVGFGMAALRVAHTFRHAALRADGSDAIGTPVNLRVIFRIAETDKRTSPHT